MNTIWQFARFCVRIAVVRSFVRLRRTALLWHVVVCMPILNQSSTAGNVAWERKGTERCRRFASWIANAGTSSRYRRRLQVASESFWTWRLLVLPFVPWWLNITCRRASPEVKKRQLFTYHAHWHGVRPVCDRDWWTSCENDLRVAGWILEGRRRPERFFKCTVCVCYHFA